MQNSFQAERPLAAMAGGVVWIVLLALAALKLLPLGAIELIFLLAPLVIVPLGIRILVSFTTRRLEALCFGWVRALQPLGAALAVLSFCFPAGKTASLLAAGWLVVCGLAGLCGALSLFQNGMGSVEQVCFSTALLYLPVGGIGLATSRLGLELIGFKEPIVLLTAVHFHYAGFAALLLTGATARMMSSTSAIKHKLLNAVGWAVVVMPALVAIGFIFSPLLKMISSYVLAASLTGLGVLTLESLTAIKPKIARWLLAVSALAIPAAMMLVCVYALGDFMGQELITIPQMAVSHGILNSAGFALCGLLGWNLALRQEFSSASEEDARAPKISLEVRES